MIGIRTNGEVCGGEETTPKQRVVCTRDIVIVATTGEERLEAVVGGDTLSCSASIKMLLTFWP